MRYWWLFILVFAPFSAYGTLKADVGCYGLYLPASFYKNQVEWHAAPYADIYIHKMHFFPRYNFDFLNMLSLNVGYDVIKTMNDQLILNTSFGWALGSLSGPIGGFQLTYNFKILQVYGINQYLHNVHESKQQNWYTWSEANTKILKYFRLGHSIFSDILYKPVLHFLIQAHYS